MLDYHGILLEDETRTSSFITALERTVTPGCRVLDVGTGTGILALAAARLGASVTAVERTEMVDYARCLAAHNGVRVDFIDRDIRQVAVDEIPPFDVIVSEMIGNALLDEDLVSVMASARRFLKPGGRLIPESVRFEAAAAASSLVTRAVAFWREPRYGFSFEPLSGCIENCYLLDHARDAKRMGPASVFSEIDLHRAAEDRFAGDVALRVDGTGEVNAILAWWRARLAEGVELSFAPDDAWPKQHWYRILLPVTPRHVAPGDSLAFSLSYDATAPHAVWTWGCEGERRSTFFSVPPTRERMARFFERQP